MRNVLFSNNFAIMTAENPMHPVAMQGGNAALEKELASKRLKFHKIKGKYGGNSENSYLIENPNHDVIIDLGKKFGQDSVIVSKNGQHKMVYTNGPDTGKHHLGNSIETFDKEPQDYFSTGMDKGKPFHFSINFDMDTKHHDSLNKSESKYLVHFSNTSGLTELDPMMQGSAGRHSPETKHGRPEHPRTYFYEEGAPTESVVTSGAKSKYLIKHPDYDKIYDMGKDPHGLIPQAQQAWRERPRGSLNDMFFKLLKDKGFLGFKNSASALPNVVGMFYKTPVHAEIPMPTDWSEIKNWTEATTSMKKSDIKQAVKEIKGSAKVNEVLAEASADKRSQILSALRKEKLEKMNGMGVPGTGGATPPMMKPPVPAAPAMTGLAKADESESKMAKKDLKDILEYAQALDGMVVESEDLEDWVDSKIAVARQYLSDIAHYLSYEHGQPTEELDKGDVIGMKDKKVISTDTQPASKELVAAQPKAAKNERALAQRLKSNWEGPKPSLAKADASHVKNTIESKTNPKLKQNPNQDAKKILDSKPDFSSAYKKHPHLSTIQIDKIVEKDPAAAAKYLSKSDSKKAKFERCVMAVKKKSGKKVNPWAVCHASVDGKMEKADMSVKEQEKPTKGMPQAKQLKADADLEKIKEGAENVLETADKKKDNLNKSAEELEKGKNYKEQRAAVFGGWKTSAKSKKREKQMSALADMIKRRFGLIAERAPGKKNAAGKIIDKPNFHDNVVEHIGNPDSLVHEIGHLYQYGKDMNTINPHKDFKDKEQSMTEWQKDMDEHWGKMNMLGHGYKKHAQMAEEYEPMALENYYRRRAGLPPHQKTAKTEEENRIASEKRGKKYKKPSISRTQAVDDPSKEIVQKIKVKGKNGKEKELWLTGTSKNLTDKTKELVDRIDRGELVLDPKRGFVQGTSPDAKINIRAREAAKDKTRKDADTLMRSEELKKKLIVGEGKPSKATKKATPEQRKEIMERLSTALDTVKVDQSPEASKERKMLLERVKSKLTGKK